MAALLRETGRQRRRNRHLVPVLVVVCGLLAAIFCAAPRRLLALAVAGDGVGGAGTTVSGMTDAELPEFLVKAYSEIDKLAQLVKQKGVVSGFGKRAGDIVSRAAKDAGEVGADADSVEQALDPPLHALFRLQLQLLLAQAADTYDLQMASRPNPVEASLAAKKFFLDGVVGLERPGSGWGCEQELQDLVGRIQESYGVDEQIIGEQVKQGQGKQVTIEVIKKLQQQAAAVQREADTRGAFPWNVKWQYFVENSPLGFRGQYTQGRSVVELLLMPSPDPRLKKNLLNRIGPLNVAVAFDMLM